MATATQKASTSSNTGGSNSGTGSRYVPIRPLFRPLLPKPAPTANISGKSKSQPSSAFKPKMSASSSATLSTSCTSLKTSTSSTSPTTTPSPAASSLPKTTAKVNKSTKANKESVSSTNCANKSATMGGSLNAAAGPAAKMERRRSDGSDNKKPAKKAAAAATTTTAGTAAPKERKTKKRTQSQPSLLAPQTLPSTISPASLVCKKKKASTTAKATKGKKNNNKNTVDNINTLLSSGATALDACPEIDGNAMRASTKVMLSMGDGDLQLPTGNTFDLAKSDLYLFGGPTSPSSLVESLWGEGGDDAGSIAAVSSTSTGASSPYDDGSPIDSLDLTMDSNLSSYTLAEQQLLTLESYLTPESEEGIDEFRDSFSFMGTAVSN